MQRNGAAMYRYLVIASVILSGMWLPTSVRAHRVNIFAWLEGDTVQTQSTANRGKPIVNGEIKVYDGNGTVLLTGVTDAEGKFNFSRPVAGSLKIELVAGPGHANFWTLDAQSPEAPETVGHSHSQNDTVSHQGFSAEPLAKSALTAMEITEIVETVLARRLAPLQEQMAAYYSRGAGIKEILGGIGYILGLVGVGAYFHYRQKAAALEERN